MLQFIFPILLLGVFIFFLILLVRLYQRSYRFPVKFFSVRTGFLWGILLALLVITLHFVCEILFEFKIDPQFMFRFWIVSLVLVLVMQGFLQKKSLIPTVKTFVVTIIVSPLAFFGIFEILGYSIPAVVRVLRF